MRAFRTAVWLLVAVLGGVLVYFAIAGAPKPGFPEAPVTAKESPPGGPFSMISHTGERVTEATYAGKARLVFVGFTNCPDICPTTLAEMSSWFEELGPEADRLQGFLVSVDPERDTLERLASYMSSFDKRIVALRPEPAELKRFAAAYKIYYKKVPLEGAEYTMDHTAGVLMFDLDGRFGGTIDLHEKRSVAMEKLRHLISD